MEGGRKVEVSAPKKPDARYKDDFVQMGKVSLAPKVEAELSRLRIDKAEFLKDYPSIKNAVDANPALVEGWAVLHKSGVDEATRISKFEDVKKYLDANPNKSIDDVAKEIKAAGGYSTWVKALIKQNTSGVTSVKIGSMHMSPKAKTTAKNMEKAFNQVLEEFKKKFKGFADGVPQNINVVYSNGRTSFYMHKTSASRYKTHKIEKENFPLSADDLKEIQKLEKNGEIDHLLEFVNKGFSGRSASQLKKDLLFRGALAHEFGHVFHWKRNLVTNTGMTLEIVTYYRKCQDAFRKISQSGLDLLKKGDELDVIATFGKKIPKEKLEYYWDAVGDLSLALSQGKIGFGRTNPNYYLIGNTPQKELIAHTTDFYLNGNPLVEVILGKDMVKTLQAFGDKHFK